MMSSVAVRMASHVLAIVCHLLSSFVDLHGSQMGLDLDLIEDTGVR